MNPLLDFWWGFEQYGPISKNIVIIGFSLNEHVTYIRQCIYSVINNFQNSTYQQKYDKSNVILVDYRKTEKEQSEYKNTYRFVNPAKVVYYFDGFNEDVVHTIFDEESL